jgi:hypothetical protein
MHFHEAVAKAKSVALQAGRHVPLLWVEGTKQEYALWLDTLPVHPLERHLKFFEAGYTVARDKELGKLVQVFFISEAWLSIVRQGKLPDIQPSEDPQRQEVLIVSCYNLKNHTKDISVLSYVREKKSKLIAIKELSSGNAGLQFASPLLDTFLAGYHS